MKICHIITGLDDGGAEAVLYRLINADKSNRHRVVSLMGAGKYGPLLEQIGVQVTCMNMPRGRVTFSGLYTLWSVLRQEKPDVVQTWMYHADLLGGALARCAGLRRIFWGVRNSSLELAKSNRKTLAIAKVNALVSRWIPTAIICCAERARQVHRSLGYDHRKLMVIHNGYDLNLFKPDSKARIRLRAEWHVDPAMPLFGMVGRFDPQKDHENLLCALASLKLDGTPFRCTLVGLGLDASNMELVTWLQKYCLNEEVILLGQRSNMPDIMNALDLHVLSSAGEAFPNVLAEAMACGTPCVTTDVGDAALIVGDTGWVVPHENPQALADAIKDALLKSMDIEAWQVRKAAVRDRIEHYFSIHEMTEAYKLVWERGC